MMHLWVSWMWIEVSMHACPCPCPNPCLYQVTDGARDWKDSSRVAHANAVVVTVTLVTVVNVVVLPRYS